MNERFFDGLVRIDKLVEVGPIGVDFDSEVRPLIEDTQAERYFFSKIDDPAWFPILKDAGVFRTIPELEHNGAGDIGAYPLWFPSWVLLKLAGSAPREVMEIVTELPETNNQRVHEILLRTSLAALEGAQEAVELWVPREAAWLGLQKRIDTLVIGTATNLAVKLCINCSDAAYVLVEAMLSLHVPPSDVGISSRPTPRMEYWHYEEVLEKLRHPFAECFRHRSLELFIDLLVKATGAIDAQKVDQTICIWRPAIEESEQNDPNNLLNWLVVSVRDAAIQLIDEGESDVLSLLEQSDYQILHRIALHIRRVRPKLDPEETADIITSVEKRDNTIVRHELFSLITDLFSSLPETTQTEYFDFIGTLKEPSKQYLYLWPIHESLPEDWEERYAKFEAQFEKLEHPDLPIYHGPVWVGPTSPWSADDMKQKPVSVLVEYLKKWSPTGGFEEPSPEGISRELAKLAKEDAERIGRSAVELVGLDPTYIRGVAQGLGDAVREEGTAINWLSVMELLVWAVEEPRDTGKGSGSIEDFDPDWGPARKQIGRLLEAGFQQGEAEIPASLREKAWEVLKGLLQDPDPTPKEEHERLESMDPSTIAINTVRGIAMGSVMYYAYWVRRRMHSAPKHTTLTSFAPEVVATLDHHLETTRERSLAVRSVYGKWLPQLIGLDREWALGNLERIFPREQEEFWSAAWDAYLAFGRVYIDLLADLRPLYERAIQRVGDPQRTQKALADPDQRLGGHLILFYRHGAIELKDRLLTGFWQRAGDELRYSVLTDAVRGIQKLEVEDLAVARERLRALWDWRMELAQQSDLGKEPTAFCWWFIKDEFDDDWALTELERAFKHGAELELDGQVLEKLKNLSIDNARQALRCLELVVKDPRNQRWGIYKDHVKDVLQAVLRADDPKVRNQAQDLVHFIGSKGFFSFRELLDKYSAEL